MDQPIHSHVFDNGLALVAEPILSRESAAFSIVAPAGCVTEPARRAGLASFTVDMALRGAGPRDSRQFITDLDNLGVERDDGVSDANASFSGATLARNLPAALGIYADLLRRAHLPEAQLEASRQVLLQELQGVEDEPAQRLMIELRRHHYPPPWGRPTQGDRPGLEGISLDDVQRHYATGFRPNGAILGVAGRFEWPALRAEVERLFGDWKPVESSAPQEGAALPRQAHVDNETNQTQIGIAYPSVPYSHPDYFQAWGAVGVLSGGMSARLFTEVREKRGLCYSVHASNHTLKHRGSVLCYAGTSAERAQETLDVTLRELLRLVEGVQPFELDRLKARIKSSLIMQHESSSARAAALAREWYHLGRARTLDEIGALVDALSCESINDYLRRNPPGPFTIVTLGPRPLEIPNGVH